MLIGCDVCREQVDVEGGECACEKQREQADDGDGDLRGDHNSSSRLVLLTVDGFEDAPVMNAETTS